MSFNTVTSGGQITTDLFNEINDVNNSGMVVHPTDKDVWYTNVSNKRELHVINWRCYSRFDVMDTYTYVYPATYLNLYINDLSTVIARCYSFFGAYNAVDYPLYSAITIWSEDVAMVIINPGESYLVNGDGKIDFWYKVEIC